MKNQYFGDINDYKKYSLIRYLSRFGLMKTAICWLLTHDDNGGDGNHIKYLSHPEKWREYDTTLYDFLQENVAIRKKRNVKLLEKSDIIENCIFYSEFVEDNAKSRKTYIKKFLKFAENSDLVFFDPDNGLEVKSIKFGRKNSSKYLYWDEVKKTYKVGHSLLIYQHFPRMQRESYINNLVRQFKKITKSKHIIYYKTQHVVFFLLAQPNHEYIFTENNENILNVWKGAISYCELKLD